MSNMTKTMAVFAGSTCPELAEDIATALGTTLGNVKLEKFSNGEIYARYLESVRGADVFIVQSTSTPNVNEAVMELLIMADAAKRASARTVNAVVPCYGYARQDRKAAAREPITAKLVANIMTFIRARSRASSILRLTTLRRCLFLPITSARRISTPKSCA